MEKNPQYNIIISDHAQKMLVGHIKFLANESPSAARRTKENLLKAICSLYEMSNCFPFFDAEFIKPNKYHKMFVQKYYLIIYPIKDKTVYVDYI